MASPATYSLASSLVDAMMSDAPSSEAQAPVGAGPGHVGASLGGAAGAGGPASERVIDYTRVKLLLTKLCAPRVQAHDVSTSTIQSKGWQQWLDVEARAGMALMDRDGDGCVSRSEVRD